MAQFSEADINAAKRRVLDMRNRASQYTGENTVHNINPENKAERQSEKQNKKTEEKISEEKSNNESNADTDTDTEQEKSLFIILALILILSREGADHKLILALLYLLL